MLYDVRHIVCAHITHMALDLPKYRESKRTLRLMAASSITEANSSYTINECVMKIRASSYFYARFTCVSDGVSAVDVCTVLTLQTTDVQS
jgi:hypothetical protein